MESSMGFGLNLGLRNWPDIAQLLSRAVAILGAVAYGAGLLVINIHLSSFGVKTTGLVRADYFVAGLLWIFLTLVFAGSYYFGLQRLAGKALRAWRADDRFGGLVDLLIGIGGFLAMLASLLLHSGLSKHDLMSWVTAKILLGIGAPAMIMIQPALLARDYWTKLKAEPDWEPTPHMRHQTLLYMLMLAPMFLGALGAYAYFSYPYLNPALGGGDHAEVILVTEPEAHEVWLQLGLPDPKQPNLYGPVIPLADTGGRFHFRLRREGRDSYAIREDFIQAIKVLDSHHDKKGSTQSAD